MFLTVLPRKIKKIINQNLLDKNNLLNNFECYFLNCSSSNLLNFNQKTERMFSQNYTKQLGPHIKNKSNGNLANTKFSNTAIQRSLSVRVRQGF